MYAYSASSIKLLLDDIDRLTKATELDNPLMITHCEEQVKYTIGILVRENIKHGKENKS